MADYGSKRKWELQVPKYNKRVTCSTSASFNDRTTSKLKVSQGVISQVSVTWSFGSNFLNALVVKFESGQIIPSEGGGECRGNGNPEIWPEYIVLDKTHPEIDIEVWNDGNEHEQDVLLSIVVLPEEPSWITPIREFVSMFRQLIGT